MATDPRDFVKSFPLVPHHDIPETFADDISLTFLWKHLCMEFMAARIDELKG